MLEPTALERELDTVEEKEEERAVVEEREDEIIGMEVEEVPLALVLLLEPITAPLLSKRPVPLVEIAVARVTLQ